MKDSRYIILSDIHGNLSALKAVIKDFETKRYDVDGIIVLGDNINYGMRSNEVINLLLDLENKYPIIVNLAGNHEYSLMRGDTTKFSTQRGKEILHFTESKLTDVSNQYIRNLVQEGWKEIIVNNKKILCVHGNREDPYWGKLNCSNVLNEVYKEYDYVLSGHSHIPHFLEQFYKVDNPAYRNKKKTIFLNPGSVGQPRNHNNLSSYLYVDFDLETFHFNKVPYDIVTEQSLYSPEIDKFYSERLNLGI